jgi:phosphate starvation-inducible protein PhoH
MDEETHNYRLTRKEKRLQRQQNKQEAVQQQSIKEKLNFVLKYIKPLTPSQERVFEDYQNKDLLLHGYAGTGKSFVAIYLALKQLIEEPNSSYKKIVIVRSTVPTRDQGFLPGSSKEKSKEYELPYQAICNELFGRGDAYDYLKNKKLIEFISTSYIRGLTINNAIIFADEIENFSFHELDSVITRTGKGCKLIYGGDFTQTDFIYDKDKDGLKKFMKILENMKCFSFIEFSEQDIVRSGKVKEYIITKNRMKL